jgi:ABC-type protease/lipase transport system fused ATPase/permease subunit
MPRYLQPLLPPLAVSAFFSIFINLLALSYMFYLRLLFDKVMLSRSVETLVLLTALVLAAYVVSGVLTALRSKLLVRIGVRFEQLASAQVFRHMLGHSVTAGAARNN